MQVKDVREFVVGAILRDIEFTAESYFRFVICVCSRIDRRSFLDAHVCTFLLEMVGGMCTRPI